MEEQNIKNWCLTLRQFNYLVTKKHFPPKYWHGTITKSESMGMLTAYVNSIGQYELFEAELLKVVSQAQNPKVILTHWRDEFMPTITQYKKWFVEHETETKIFGTYNPYEIMDEAMTRTECELKRYEEAIKSKKKQTAQLRDTLEKVCIGPEQYQVLRAWFIDHELCDPQTFAWKGDKKLLANYLKDISIKCYVLPKLSQEEMIALALNDFKIKLSRRLINDAKGYHATTKSPELPACMK